MRERTDKATKGPWAVRPKEFDDWGIVRAPDGCIAAKAYAGRGVDLNEIDEFRKAKADPTQHNADFIAHARTDVPLLLRLVEIMTPYAPSGCCCPVGQCNCRAGVFDAAIQAALEET
jgi:hypothetical protein